MLFNFKMGFLKKKNANIKGGRRQRWKRRRRRKRKKKRRKKRKQEGEKPEENLRAKHDDAYVLADCPRPTFFMERTVTLLAHRVLGLRGSSHSSRAEIKDTDRSHYTGKDRGWSKMGTLALWADALRSP